MVSGLHIVTMLVNVFKEFLRGKKRNCIHIKCKMMGFGFYPKSPGTQVIKCPEEKENGKVMVIRFAWSVK